MHDTIRANPGPLGLMGFGMTTILLNIHNAGFSPVNVAIVAMGIFYGGITQIIAGILEYKKGNTFGLTAFTSYGCFWLTLIAIWFLPTNNIVQEADNSFFGIYLALWGIFTLFMFFGTLRSNHGLQFVFASLTVLFFLLSIANISGIKMILHIAGYEGMVCGASAIYLAMAEVLNEQFGRTVLPINFNKK